MGARIRPTVPHSGALPHREHRSDKTRQEGYRHTRATRAMKSEKIKKILEEEIADEIRSANENADQ